MAIDNDAETSAVKTAPIKPALVAESTWAKLYAKTMQEDLVAISTVTSKSEPTTAGLEMKKPAEKFHDQLQEANRSVGELSDHVGVRPVPVKT